MEGPILPGGSGGKEPPELPGQLALWDERARLQQEKRLMQFEQALDERARGKRKKRRAFNDYRTKNCEEASSEGWIPRA